jgi:YidC/Oxa1 family membrane protein insertase
MALPPTPTGPTTFAERQLGLGTSWLLPQVDGAPPIGWDEASAYLALPIALVAVQ